MKGINQSSLSLVDDQVQFWFTNNEIFRFMVEPRRKHDGEFSCWKYTKKRRIFVGDDDAQIAAWREKWQNTKVLS